MSKMGEKMIQKLNKEREIKFIQSLINIFKVNQNYLINKLKNILIFELLKYKKFHDHVLNHKEVQEAPTNPNQVMCKVCNKTFKEIIENGQRIKSLGKAD